MISGLEIKILELQRIRDDLTSLVDNSLTINPYERAILWKTTQSIDLMCLGFQQQITQAEKDFIKASDHLI